MTAVTAIELYTMIKICMNMIFIANDEILCVSMWSTHDVMMRLFHYIIHDDDYLYVHILLMSIIICPF